MKQARRKTSGFTLLELLMVVIIIGILASLALPGFIKASERARASEVVIYFGQVKEAIRRYCVQNGGLTAPTQFSDLDIENMASDAAFLSRWALTSPFSPAISCANPINITLVATRIAGTPCATSTVTYNSANNPPFAYAWAGACL